MRTTLFPHKVETLPRTVGFRFEVATIHGRRFEAEIVGVHYSVPEIRDVQNRGLIPLAEIKGWRHVQP